MSNKGLMQEQNESSTAARDVREPSRQAKGKGLLLRLLNDLASLRLTVILFALSIALVFFGTLAQVDGGVWTIVRHYFRALIVWVPFQIFARFGQVFLGFSASLELPGSFPFPGGWLLGGLLLVNLLAAHAVRFRITWKRSGILVLHFGLIILMLSELITGLLAVEGNMTIETGKSANYLIHQQHGELAIVEASNPKFDEVTVVPDSVLRAGGLIQHELLPFDIEVVRYMVNSSPPRKATSSQSNLATAGIGTEAVVEEKSEYSGADPEQKIDAPSAYLSFRKKGSGESLGTYLVSLWLDLPQDLVVDGKTFELSLRQKRTYKPYTFYLKEFRHDRYLGTDIPKNYSSRVRLVDPKRGEDREVTISMNQPLRYEGETFYQSGVYGDDQGTILQVVHNPGWLMPYISCVLVALGMIIHFGQNLITFLLRRLA